MERVVRPQMGTSTLMERVVRTQMVMSTLMERVVKTRIGTSTLMESGEGGENSDGDEHFHGEGGVRTRMATSTS